MCMLAFVGGEKIHRKYGISRGIVSIPGVKVNGANESLDQRRVSPGAEIT